MSITCEQFGALLDFLEEHPDLARGRIARGTEGRSLSRRLWSEAAAILNSVSANCPQKTSEQWRMYYNEFKSKTLKKIKNNKIQRSGTGGGPAKILILTTSQERLFNLLGRDVGEPLTGVRHNPLAANAYDNGTGASVSGMPVGTEDAIDPWSRPPRSINQLDAGASVVQVDVHSEDAIDLWLRPQSELEIPLDIAVAGSSGSGFTNQESLSILNPDPETAGSQEPIYWPESTPVRARATPVRARATPVRARATPVRARATPVRARATPVRARARPVRASSPDESDPINIGQSVQRLETSDRIIADAILQLAQAVTKVATAVSEHTEFQKMAMSRRHTAGRTPGIDEREVFSNTDESI